ncbi:hypothetical protein BGW37DRAFT_405434, partial [Umbelopsis sp. PMI_123]
MDFLQAVTENKLVDVRGLLQAGFDVNSLIGWNAKHTFTPLISKRIASQPEIFKKIQNDEEYYAHPLNLAVIGGHEDMVRLLLSAGADINLKDGRGRTAVMCAIYGLDLDSSCINGANAPLIAQTHQSHLDIMRNCLLGHHNLHVATLDSAQNDANGITPLCMASYLGKTEIMTLLLEDGRVNVDGADNKNATPLMYAARDGNAVNVKLLLQYDASPDVTDDHGWSALQWGARNPEIVLLCEEALRSRRPEVLSTSSQYVKYPTNYTRLFSLINSLPPFSSSLSHLQLNPLPSPTEDVQEALDLSFDLQKTQAALLVAIKAHDHLSIQSLLLTPPIPASANQQSYNTTILVNHHDAKTGLTPLHHAIRSKPLPSLETITMLFQAGADINAQSAYGRTALHHLCRFGVDKENNSLNNSEAPFGTFENNVELDSTANACRHLARCASLLIRLGALVNHPDPTGNTPLHFAAEFGCIVEVIEVLVREGNANITYKNKRGFTPLEIVKSEAAKKTLEGTENKVGNNTRSAFKRQSSVISPSENLPPSRNLKALVLGGEPTKLDHVIQIPQTLEELREQFIQILRNIFYYLTTGTKSIESLLAKITDMVLRPANSDADQQRHFAQLRTSIDGLRIQLEQTYALFDITDEQYQSVVVWYQQDMDGIEAFNMELWERCEVERENIEAVYDAYEKLCDRVKDLECDNDQLARKVEALRRKGNRILEKACKSVSDHDNITERELSSMENIQFIMEAMVVLEADSRRHPSNAKRIQQKNMMEEFDSLIVEHSEQIEKEIAEITMNSLKNTKNLNNPESKSLIDDMEYSKKLQLSISPLSTKERASLLKSEKPQRLNHLELTFDILMSNLHEIEKDIYEADKRIHQILSSKRNMYENRLDLEDQLSSIDKVHSPEQTELSAIMDQTAQLFEEQQRLISERATLDNEHQEKRAEIEDIKAEIGQVRPAELLSGLLERLETEEPNLVVIQKDWKEDVECVSEVVYDDDVDGNTDTENDISFGKGSIEIRCRLFKLESSLHTLKISCESQLQSLKFKLSESQAILLQAERELSQGRDRLNYMCEDLSDIQRQVFVLKRELEIVIQHRKEEIIKVWEVVNDVRDGVLHNYSANTAAHNSSKGESSQNQQEPGDEAQDQEQQELILNELEQYYIVHENLLSALEQQRKDQTKISSSTLPTIISTLQSQQEALMASDEPSIMETTLVLGHLIDSVRKREL